jgi:hydroxymethylbilane synthase
MRIGTRGSALALWQARTVARLIEAAGGPACEIVVIRTSGDEAPGPPDPPPSTPSTLGTLGTLGTPGTPGTLGTPGTPGTLGTPGTPGTLPLLNVKRAFVKEIEEALLDGRVDLAVHSSKDLPAALPDGLRIAAALSRGDPRDALVLPATSAAQGLDAVVAALGSAARVGTSSVRRAAQLSTLLPGATFAPVRGNVDTRLRKLDAGDCGAIVLAAAGLIRLGLESRISAPIPIDVCVPAPGQGIVAVEVADSASADVTACVAAIADADAMTALVAERAVVQALGGSCQMPLGVIATVDEHAVLVLASVAAPDGRRVLRASQSGNRGNPAAVGEKLAAELLRRGAGDILSSLHTK